MNPLEKCKALQAELVALAGSYEEYVLPERRYCVLAEPVIECEGVIIALTGVSVPEGFDTTCGPPQLGTFNISITRECAAPFDEDGITIPDQAEEVSAIQAVDGDMLWLFASRHQPFVAKPPWTIGYVITGGLMITSLLLSTGID